MLDIVGNKVTMTVQTHINFWRYNMITPEKFQQALDTNRQIIECIFQQEDSFKEYLVNDLHYFRLKYPETYELERIHVSGHRFRITVIFEDMGELDLYIDAHNVYHWYEQEYKRLRGGL